MRGIAILIIAVVVLALIGWITFNVSSERPGVNIETEKVEHDTEKLIDAGRELVNDAGAALEDATEDDVTDSAGDAEVGDDERSEIDEPITGGDIERP